MSIYATESQALKGLNKEMAINVTQLLEEVRELRSKLQGTTSAYRRALKQTVATADDCLGLVDQALNSQEVRRQALFAIADHLSNLIALRAFLSELEIEGPEDG